ncbi:MAG: DUF5110 domain-containing protein, partial [bacterium]
APYTDIPIYVKEGSIIPLGPEMQYATEKPANPILLYVYAGKDAHFELYEDENVNYNYEKGMYSIIPINYDDKTSMLYIEKRQGEFAGMLKQRTFRIIRVTKDEKTPLDFSASPDKIIEYDGSEKMIKFD